MSPSLKRSYDRKVSPYSRLRGKASARWYPQVGNAFGLPAVKSCPGATYGPKGCVDVCYADAIKYPSVLNLLQHNYDLLLSSSSPSDLLTEMVWDYRSEHDKHIPGAPYAFRIHWSGDYYDEPYAHAWRAVMEEHEAVTFWSYTRSLFVAEILSGLPNHALYLSSDPVNQAEVLEIAGKYRLPIAALDDQPLLNTEPEFSPVKCPETYKRIPLVSDQGEGACITCGACIRGRRDIVFNIT
jgi:ferredoxin